jgi:PPIC-type PPIASE domain
MPYLVNGQLLTPDRVRAEEARVGRDLSWQSISDLLERARRIHAAAEFAAIDVLLVEQAAASDPRPVDPALLENEMRKQRAMGNCRTRQHERSVYEWIEWSLRLQRTAHEMTAGARAPALADMQRFYDENRENFYGCAMFRAAHVVKHVSALQSEEQARAGIEAAETELAAGARFEEVVARHSDCKERGGDLGLFRAGSMAPEFEDAIRDLKPSKKLLDSPTHPG